MSDKPLIHLTIDGNEISVEHGTTVYQAAKKIGIDIPIFCYQDRMPPFGACRMCLVEVEKMAKLQTSCTLEASNGMVVKTATPQAIEGRKGIVEFLLINHPLDCPICDRGGECPLQENALKHGPGLSRFFEEKRHFKKPIPMSPVLMLDRERCIVCARCTRFGELVAGDNALEFIERGYKTEVGTPKGQPAESKFIGNTIMICPVGALTSNVYRFRARPWDNDSTNSSCTLCPVGCSLILDARDGEILRTRSRENKAVNDIWLCDKGWFGYEYSSHPDRVQKPYIRRNGSLQPSNWEESISLAAEKFLEAKSNGKIAGLGGDTLTVEENYLFQKLIRELGGVNHLDHRIGVPILALDEEGIQAGMQISLEECETVSFAALIGIDLTEEFPLIWLRLKQALNHGATATFIGHFAPEIGKHLTNITLHRPGRELQELTQHLSSITEFAKSGKQGALFVGRQYLNTPDRKKILRDLQELCDLYPNLSLNILEGRGNSMGARFAGMRPDLAAFGKKLESPGLNAIQILENASKSHWDFLYVAGSNLAKKIPSKLWKQVRANVRFLVVQDLFMTETAQEADLFLPTLSFLEKKGSFINIEGRVQKLLPGKKIPENLYSDGEIFTQLALKMGKPLEIDSAFTDQLTENQRIITRQREFGKTTSSLESSPTIRGNSKLTVTFTSVLFDQGVRMQHNPHLIQLAKEPCLRIHPNEGITRGIKEGSIARVKINENALFVKVKLDKRVSEGALLLPLGFDSIPIFELGINLFNGLEVDIEQS
jgi:NADH-quinone oxidoreductase subunit G